MTDGERAQIFIAIGMKYQAGALRAEQAYDLAVLNIAAIREDERKRVPPRDTEEKHD